MLIIISRKEVINMPNKDKTGPEGKGPKTGRGLGPCGDGVPRGGGRGQRQGLATRRGGRFNKNSQEKNQEN